MTTPKPDPDLVTSEEVPSDEEVAQDFATGTEPEPEPEPDDDPTGESDPETEDDSGQA